MKRLLLPGITTACLLVSQAGDLFAADPDVASPLVSYQFFDSAAEPPAQPNVVAPLVSYQYLDTLAEPTEQPNVISPLVSYQHLDWPGDDTLTFETSTVVSFYYHGPP